MKHMAAYSDYIKQQASKHCSRQTDFSVCTISMKLKMEKAVANSLIALCVVFAASNPTANAVPYYQQRIYIQQSGVLNEITEALSVSEYLCTILSPCSCIQFLYSYREH